MVPARSGRWPTAPMCRRGFANRSKVFARNGPSPAVRVYRSDFANPSRTRRYRIDRGLFRSRRSHLGIACEWFLIIFNDFIGIAMTAQRLHEILKSAD
jgi:hypothetical protein